MCYLCHIHTSTCTHATESTCGWECRPRTGDGKAIEEVGLKTLARPQYKFGLYVLYNILIIIYSSRLLDKPYALLIQVSIVSAITNTLSIQIVDDYFPLN